MARGKAPRKSRKKPRSISISAAWRWLVRSVLRTVWWITSRVALAVTVVLGIAVAYFYATLPPVERLLDGRERGSVIMTDRYGEIFAWRGEQFGGDLRANAASPNLVNAVIATEDKRFYVHPGIDPIGMTRAMVANLRAGRVVQGGSTITQQVAKLLFFDQTRSFERHLKQIPVVLAMELKYKKDDILSIYLNRVYLGAGTNGFEAAAQRYFGKSARAVNVPEAAMLAGLLKAPSRYAPTSNLQGAQERAAIIVGLMQDQGYISETDAAAALASPAYLSDAAEARAGQHFADWIMAQAPDYLTRETSEDVVIRTTFDPAIQAAAEDAVDHVFATMVREGSRAQAALVIMSPDGAVRAMVGGRNIPGERLSEFNRATQAMRQTGSSFKPFVYAAAMELGYRPDDIIDDAPIAVDVPGPEDWEPQNYTREFYGPVPLTQALAQSLNAAAVRLGLAIGPDLVRAVAQDFGITAPLADGPAFLLGASEATLLEMTGAYAGILNKGRQALPYGLTELRLRGEATPLFEGDIGFGKPVLNERAAAYLVHMMHAVIETGSGRRARLDGRPAAGKTGTTQGARDAWFIGFTGQYVAGVWMGYDDNSELTNVTGSGLPAEIWKEAMTRAHAGLPPAPLPMRDPAIDRVAERQIGGGEPTAAPNLVERLLNSIFEADR